MKKTAALLLFAFCGVVALPVSTGVAAPGDHASFRLEKRTAIVTSRGVGKVHLGMRIRALHRRGLIGGLHPGCELEPGQRYARLRAPLDGAVTIAAGKQRVTSIQIEGGAETARHIGIGSTPDEARASYPHALYKPPGHFPPFLGGFFWVNDISHPSFTFVVDPETNAIEQIDVPSPSFCE